MHVLEHSMPETVTPIARLYAGMRTRLAPLGPILSRLRPLRRAVYRLDSLVMPRGEVRVTTSAGWSIWVNPSDHAVARTLVASGQWQPKESSLIASKLPTEGVAIDVGANIGYVTGVMAEKVGPNGLVLAFEPEETNYGFLERTVSENGWAQVSATRAACGDAPGRLALHKDPVNWGNHSLALDAELHVAGTEVVDVVTLDDVMRERRLSRLDVMKIDVQGWELKVLRGASRLKVLRPTLFAEFFPRGLRAAGTEPLELWQELLTWGQILMIQSDGGAREVTLKEAIGDPREPSWSVDLMVTPLQQP